jgi:hypothetical protein
MGFAAPFPINLDLFETSGGGALLLWPPLY